MACVLFIVIVLDNILPTLVNIQGKDKGGERGRKKIYRRCSQLQSINSRTSFFLIIVTIVIYSVVQYHSGDLVFVCGRMCVYIHTHKCKGKRVKKKKKRAACMLTHKHIANARGKEKEKKKKIVELILRRRTPYKNSVLYVWCGESEEKSVEKKKRK